MDKHELINELIDQELEQVNSKNPQFTSWHESYGAILDKFEKVERELENFKTNFELFWYAIAKSNNVGTEQRLKDLNMVIKALLLEALQVTAMCEKAENLFDQEEITKAILF